VETRLLVHEPEGWKAITYVWKDDQTDALLEIAGDDKQISFISAAGVKNRLDMWCPIKTSARAVITAMTRSCPLVPLWGN